MARQNTNEVADIIRAAVDGVVSRVSARIAAAIEEITKQDARVKAAAPSRRRGRRGARRGRSSRLTEITAWTTDRRARRVPKFVIELTSLDTKKKLVAKYGENVTFRRGEPLPPAKQAATVPVAAKPPRIRKASGA